MDRPDQHITNTVGKSQLDGALTPQGWTVSHSSADDYGVDAEVEVFRNGRSTGVTFKVQLKSSQSTSYSSASDFISQPVKVKNLRYLFEEQHVPTVLVHADIEKKQTYWCALHLEADLAERLTGLDDEAALTIRIPIHNLLPATCDELFEAVAQAEVILAGRRITTTPTADFVAIMGARKEVKQLIRDLEDKADALKIHLSTWSCRLIYPEHRTSGDTRLVEAYELFQRGELSRSESMLAELLKDQTLSRDTRFVATLTLSQVETRLAIQRGIPDEERIAIRVRAADRLRTIARGGPDHLKLYAIMAKKVAEFEMHVQRAWGLHLHSELIKKPGADPTWIAALMFEWSSNLILINHKLNDCIGFLRALVIRPDRGAFSDPVLALGKALMLWEGQLMIGSLPEPAARIHEQVFQLFRLSAELAIEANDEGRFADAALAIRIMSNDPQSESHKCAATMFSQIKSPAVREAAEQALERTRQREAGQVLEYDLKVSSRQIYQNLATAVGIDITSPTDTTAKMVRDAIDDLDPSRILRECEHLFPMLGPITLLGTRLKLPTLAPKTIYCTKHGVANRTEGSLDETYLQFKREFCASCPDSSPRQEDWTYSAEWQEQENRLKMKLLNRFRKR